MPKPVPFLWFNDQAEVAATFYTSVFPNSRIVTVARYPEGAPKPAGTVMTVQFELDGQTFIALNGGPEFQFDEAVSFVISCGDQEEIDYYWDGLSDGGEEGPCGWLKDRFGLSWQVVPEGMGELLSGPGQVEAMNAMMGMRKLDLATLRAAAQSQQPAAG